ncbi:class I SAM-dependent methyltransferase [Psychrobacillus sp. BL-248-WT-3]|uniref:class I SAM-dependent methyltransferase n=1 Tax=Psychrobacillus sp. BL-248-WT-3 TaxID=2725306 RepID=UPI00146BEE59|nr:class I SAM-dependent methyltransferase [Psychrobacillus sp. BL-248-WT-3]NME04929.1 class I SAM-dependent methyltransferase [Psychrobacillus sp. BL-248-WT-3]
MGRLITEQEDLLIVLDSLLREPKFFWDDFYRDRKREVPFFTVKPDENLVQYVERNIFKQGNVLELGCGPGRNAIYLSNKGFAVDAVDISKETIQWATERAKKENIDVNFICQNIFELNIQEGSYDIVYDSGCFHHIAPHRRMSYIQLIQRALKFGGYFAITCFSPNSEYGGATISDEEVYRSLSLKGGLGYDESKLRAIFKEFKEIEIRQMREIKPPAETLGLAGFMTAVFQKK